MFHPEGFAGSIDRRHPLLFVFIVLVKDLQMIAELQVHALGDLSECSSNCAIMSKIRSSTVIRGCPKP